MNLSANFIADYVDAIITMLVGCFALYQWYKKGRKPIYKWAGIFLIGWSFVRCFYAVSQYNEVKGEAQNNRDLMQHQIKAKIASGVPLENDSLFVFDNDLELLVPKGFVLVQQESQGLKACFLVTGLEKGVYRVSVSKVPFEEGGSFSKSIEEIENAMNSHSTYVFSANTDLSCAEQNCTAKNFQQVQENRTILSKGSVVYILKGKFFYCINYVNEDVNSVNSELMAKNLSSVIHQSIKIK